MYTSKNVSVVLNNIGKGSQLVAGIGEEESLFSRTSYFRKHLKAS